MHLDGTGLPVLDKSAVSGKRLGSLWGYVGTSGQANGDEVAAYVYTSTAKAVAQQSGEMGPEDILAPARGTHCRRRRQPVRRELREPTEPDRVRL